MADSTNIFASHPDPPEKGSKAQPSSSFPGKIIIEPSGQAPSRAADQNEEPSPPPSLLDQQATVISSQKPQVGSSFSGMGDAADMGIALVGRNLNHFKLEQFVGGGGMGAVFRGQDTHLNRTVAIKVLTRRQCTAEGAIRRFRNEAQSAARLDHENIARVYYVGEDDGWYFIVMEYIDGMNIRDLVEQQGPLDLGAAIHYTLQMAEALDHAFRRDVVHRDIKPSNILVTAEGQAKLVDMGLARLHQVETSSNDLTASGMTLGTFDYISPEQARDPRSADVRSDLYSLGCTLYYMLIGHPPFAEGTVLQKLLCHSSEAPPDPQSLRPDLPAEMTTIIHRLLAKQSKDRYQDPSELIGALLLLSDQLNLDVGAQGGAVWLAPSQVPPKPWLHHIPWVVPIVLLCAAAMAGAIWDRSSSLTNTDTPFPSYNAPDIQIPEESVNALNSSDPQTPIEPLPPSTINPPIIDLADDPSPQENGTDIPDPQPPTVDETPRVDTLPEGSHVAEDWRAPGYLGPRPLLGTLSMTHAVEGGGLTALPPNLNAAFPLSAPPINSAEEEVVAPELPAPLSRVLKVNPFPTSDSDPQSVVTLSAALDLVSTNPQIEIIELDFDGPIDILPLDLYLIDRDSNLTFRARQGRQPILQFMPNPDLESINPRAMIALHGGKVTFQDLQFEMTLPNNASKNWALFQLDQISRLRLNRCDLVITDPQVGQYQSGRNGAFFLISKMTNGESIENIPMASTQTELDLFHCIVRGEAAMVRMPEAEPLSLTWSNGFLSTSEMLLATGGAITRPMRGEHIRLDLEHVTAIVDEGLCSIKTNGGTHYPLAMDIRCESCILKTLPEAPLISQSGNLTLDELQSLMLFSGLRNFYEGGDTFWRVDAWSAGDLLEYDFEQWRSHWNSDEKRPSWGLVQWDRANAHAHPHHLQSPLDYVLSDNPGNPARGLTPDLSAGFNARLFERRWQNEEAEESQNDVNAPPVESERPPFWNPLQE